MKTIVAALLALGLLFSSTPFSYAQPVNGKEPTTEEIVAAVRAAREKAEQAKLLAEETRAKAKALLQAKLDSLVKQLETLRKLLEETDGPRPTPLPTPVPPDNGPKPEPPIPQPPSNGSSDIAKAIKALVERDVPNFPNEQDAMLAVAQVYCDSGLKIQAAIAGQTNGGPWSTVNGIISETGKEVVKALNMHGGVDNWRAFFASLRDYLNSLVQAGKLTTLQDHVTVWKGICDGLKAATNA